MPSNYTILGKNIKRKYKNGIWKTVVKLQRMPKKGLYVGHYDIICGIGYNFTNDKED